METRDVIIPERQYVGPQETPALRDLQLVRYPLRMGAKQNKIIEVIETRQGLRLNALKQVGLTTLFAKEERGKRIRLRVVVVPAHPSVDLRDIVLMSLVASQNMTVFGRDPIGATVSTTELIEVLCASFLDLALAALRRGPSQTYVRNRYVGQSVKGRVDIKNLAIRYLRGSSLIQSHQHAFTPENQYNWIVAQGLYQASKIVADQTLRRRCRTAAALFSEINPPLPTRSNKLKFTGQFNHYKQLHALAELIASGTGGDPALPGESSFLPFSITPHFVYERFISYYFALPDVLGHDFSVRKGGRKYVFEDECGQVIRSRGFLLPDIEVRSKKDGRLIMLVDAKYEEGFPALSASDFYQGYVYADLIKRHEGSAHLPVVLAAPSPSLQVAGLRRASRNLDARGHRPTVWLLGLPIGKMAREVISGGARETAGAVRESLLNILEAKPDDVIE